MELSSNFWLSFTLFIAIFDPFFRNSSYLNTSHKEQQVNFKVEIDLNLGFEATFEYCGTSLFYFYFLSSELDTNIFRVLGVHEQVSSLFTVSEKSKVKNIFTVLSLCFIAQPIV